MLSLFIPPPPPPFIFVPTGYKPKTDFPKERNLKFPTKRQNVNSLQEGKPFKDGSRYNVEEYQKYAEDFRRNYLTEHSLESLGCSESEFHSKLEKEFWRIVETNTEDVTVDYANDLNSSQYGSGFDHDPSNKWNFNNFHQSPHSLLKEIQCEIPGVTEPWVYLGSLFTSFCWHTEDHFLYSINYMHKGHGKTWYGIPSSSAESFEKAMRGYMPDRFKQSPDLIYQLVSLLSPSYCLEEGVSVYHTVQKAGDFIVTFPNAYHGGFSHGINCGEAVNFAIPEWLSYGSQAIEKYHKAGTKGEKRSDIFAHDQLLYHLGSKISKLVIANKDRINAHQRNAQELQGCIKEILMEELPYNPRVLLGTLLKDYAKSAKLELHLRRWLREAKINVADKVSYSNGSPPQCWVCRCMPYFSHVRCKNCPRRTTCLNHAFTQCDCKASSKFLAITVSDQGIQSMQSFIQSVNKSFL